MPTILMIRHAENDYVKKGRLAGRLPGVQLNQAGCQQARQLADKLGGLPIQAVYCSPLERALETAAPLASALSLQVVVRPGLLEVDMGDWQGQSLKALRRLKPWRTVQQRPSAFTFPGGESFAQAQQRIVSELFNLAAAHEPQALIACFGHGDPIKLAVAFFQGIPLDLFQRVMIGTASLTTLVLNDGIGMVHNVNVPLSLDFHG